MYLAPIISQHLGIVFLQIMSSNHGAVHKEWSELEIYPHLISVMVCGLCLNVKIYQDMKGCI